MIYKTKRLHSPRIKNLIALKFAAQSVNLLFSIMNRTYFMSVHPAFFPMSSAVAQLERMGEINAAYLGNGTIAIIA
jgi:hypothetical protein